MTSGEAIDTGILADNQTGTGTYNMDLAVPGGNSEVAVWSKVVSGTPAGTWTGTCTKAGAGMAIAMVEITGADTAAPVMGTGAKAESASATPTTASVTITSASLLLGLVTHGGSTQTINLGSTFTQLQELETATIMPYNLEYKTTATSSTVDWGIPGAPSSTAAAIAIKAASGAPARKRAMVIE